MVLKVNKESLNYYTIKAIGNSQFTNPKNRHVSYNTLASVFTDALVEKKEEEKMCVIEANF